MIAVRALRKAYGTRAVLGGVDASVEAGDVVAIVGASGCGKSTLLRCMNALERFDGGGVSIAGFELVPGERPTADLVRLRSTVGMVFQEFHLFPHLTAKGNVALAQRLVLEHSARRRRHASARAASRRRPRSARRCVSVAAFGRGEAARRHRACVGVAVEGAPPRRADERARSADARRRAGGAPRDRGEDEAHDAARDPRDAPRARAREDGVGDEGRRHRRRGAPDEVLRDGGVARELLGVGDD